MKHNELQIVTLKNRDPDILDHLFQIMCYYHTSKYKSIQYQQLYAMLLQGKQ